ncbi:MAG: trypsin-like serine protease [Gammaproteobacteria bacterium]|nr:trypsin-like serine protease [Gammaproteobacteria bacterium]MDP2142369.1 trypsin-like serine protease [Gammaproteobacteria bacterium]MDP2348610.1 trypsin-like serine protease [Gammaproteobacteria bacterium]
MRRRLLLIILLLVQISVTHAIVIRHDTGYSRHVARETQFPAVFWLEQRATRKVCVATLIHPQWAITAAHCLEDTSMLQILVRAGEYPVQIAGELHGIDHVVIHPQYQYRYSATDTDREVDLALLRLSSPLPFPVPLALYRERDELDRVATFLGWGYFGLGTTGIQVDDGRFRLARNVVSNAAERLRFDFDDPRLPDSRAVDLEGLPGLGDSGGPALLETAEGWSIAGVAVGEIGAASDPGRLGLYGAVGVYERLSGHLEWIESVIGAVPIPGHDTVSGL